MKGMKIYTLLTTIVIKKPNGLATVTLKYDNHGGGSNVAHPRSWDESAIGLLRTLSYNWTLTHQMKSRRKHE